MLLIYFFGVGRLVLIDVMCLNSWGKVLWKKMIVFNWLLIHHWILSFIDSGNIFLAIIVHSIAVFWRRWGLHVATTTIDEIIDLAESLIVRVCLDEMNIQIVWWQYTTCFYSFAAKHKLRIPVILWGKLVVKGPCNLLLVWLVLFVVCVSIAATVDNKALTQVLLWIQTESVILKASWLSPTHCALVVASLEVFKGALTFFRDLLLHHQVVLILICATFKFIFILLKNVLLHLAMLQCFNLDDPSLRWCVILSSSVTLELEGPFACNRHVKSAVFICILKSI